MAGNDYIVREMRVGNRKEAELVADMWNRSDTGWPGGWTGGIPWDADRVLRDFMTWHAYAHWVAEHHGEIVGYVNLEADPANPTRAYVGLLSARPDHHGKGVGRRLLRQALRRAIETGFDEVDLNTWPGNLKAVPLYKKTGFFWSPETSVSMQNFIPTIIRMPLLADFFAGHDWYAVQERDLSVCEDVVRRRGVRVYPYRFAAEGRHIEVVIDRQARMPTAVETDELAVEAWVGAEDLCALQEHTLCYELRNKTDRPMAVSLLARGEAGVPVALEKSFQLEGRKRLSVPFRIPIDLERKKPGEPPHRVLSTVTVDGVPIRLGTAVRMRHPVEIEYSGQGLAVGNWSDVRIRLRNRLPFPVSGMLLLASSGDVEREDEKLSFRIPRGRWGQASFRARPSSTGVHRLELCASLDRKTAERLAKGDTAPLASKGRPRAAALRALEPGRWVASRDDHERVVTVESDRQTVSFRQVYGRLSVSDSGLSRYLFSMNMPEVGPPFGEFRPTPPVYDVEVRSADGGAELVTRQTYDRHPGLIVERTVSVTAGMLEVRHRLINGGDRALSTQLRTECWGGMHPGRTTVPTGSGLLQHERTGGGDWPRWGELMQRTSDFTESWAATDEDGAVTGVVWQGDADVQVYGNGGSQITYDAVTVPPGGAVAVPPLRIVGGPGDYRVVRGVWRRYVCPKSLVKPEERDPDTRALLRCNLSQAPVMLAGDGREVDLELTVEQRRALEGEAVLQLPNVATLADGKRKLTFPVAGAKKGAPFHKSIVLRPASSKPTAAEGRLLLDAQMGRCEFAVPVVVTGVPGAAIEVTEPEDGLVCVDTGTLSFSVSAEHGGSIVSLRSGRQQLVRTSYPVPRPYQWMSPWYGGICAQAGHGWDRRYLQIRRRVEPVTLEGASGLRWQGAKVSATLTHDDLKWLRYTAHYLSLPGSNLIAVLLHVHNRAPVNMGVGAHVELWPKTPKPRAVVERDGRQCEYVPDQHGYSVRGKSWLAVRCGTKMVAMASCAGRDRQVVLENYGDGQLSAQAASYASFTPPVCTFETLTWLAVCRSDDEAYAYRHLRELKKLP